MHRRCATCVLFAIAQDCMLILKLAQSLFCAYCAPNGIFRLHHEKKLLQIEHKQRTIRKLYNMDIHEHILLLGNYNIMCLPSTQCYCCSPSYYSHLFVLLRWEIFLHLLEKKACFSSLSLPHNHIL